MCKAKFYSAVNENGDLCLRVNTNATGALLARPHIYKPDGSVVFGDGTTVPVVDREFANWAAVKAAAEECECPSLKDYETLCSSDGNVWTLFSKLGPPHPGGFPEYGQVTSGNHPDGLTGDITGWRVYTTCSATQPPADGNGHVWLSGVPGSFATNPVINVTGTVAVCDSSKVLGTLGCLDKEIKGYVETTATLMGTLVNYMTLGQLPVLTAIRDKLFAVCGGTGAAAPINVNVCNGADADCPDPVEQSLSGRAPSTANLVIPGNTYSSVTINNISGITRITSAGNFELGNGRRVDAITYDSTNHSCINGRLTAITASGGTFQWTGVRAL